MKNGVGVNECNEKITKYRLPRNVRAPQWHIW